MSTDDFLEIPPRQSTDSPMMPTYRVSVTPYVAAGTAPAPATIVLFIALISAGVGFGWLMRELLGNIGCCAFCFSWLTLILLGVVLGGVGYLGVTLGRISNPHIAGMAGLAGMVGVIVGNLLSEYGRAAIPRPDFWQFAFSREFREYALFTVSFVVGGGSCYAVIAAAANRPFCTVCNSWKSRYSLGRPDLWRSETVSTIERGELLDFAAVNPNGPKSRAEVLAHVCSHCGGNSTMVLEVRDTVLDEKKKPVETSLTMMTYPGEFWPVLEKLFPNRLPDPDEAFQSDYSDFDAPKE
ncbi:hypothetical protein [Tuwongella immobilis]|uniref:Uncharacterized protein n=1 Tax=Tuwongella immobilis TaxID=692036 RepID=A0A6C2YNB3_9BACT|nr:hypothetical protein [Tuwongella immobilis]VIP02867.1 unnamed protein product [Tuwongella immobilis]VTS02689.1 unnamed protein product [Tuwongella immobilis]